MTKRTITKQHRIYEKSPETGMPVRRSTRLPAATLGSKLCELCERPMNVSEGQIGRFHKLCRKMRSNKGRRKLKKLLDIEDTMPSSRGIKGTA